MNGTKLRVFWDDFRSHLSLYSISKHPMMLAEMRDGGVFLQPASAISVRDIPLDEIKQWIAEDEKDVEAFWNKIT